MDFSARLSLTGLDWAICVAVLAMSLLVGLLDRVADASSADSSSFFLAGRHLLAGHRRLAVRDQHRRRAPGGALRRRLPLRLQRGVDELTTPLSLGIACAILYPYYIRNKVYTIPEFLEIRYKLRPGSFFGLDARDLAS